MKSGTTYAAQPRKWMFTLFNLVVIFIMIGNSAVQASGFPAPPVQTGGDWKELRTKSFAILYPVGYEQLAQGLYGLYGSILDEEYKRFATLFEADLPLPISIRVYPTIDDYLKLNSLAPQIGPKDTHSHIGYREISVIGNNVSNNLAQWISVALDAFRFELAILFSSMLSNQKAPPGLQAGMGGYAQDPTPRMQNPETLKQINSAQPQTWRAIFEDEAALTDPVLQFQATSIVAYLVDEYGWGKFLKFLTGLSTAEGYRQAVDDSFGQPLNTLQENWNGYYPFYLQGRWKAHILYNYDFSTSQKLIEAGAYSAAVQELSASLEFLQKMNQKNKLTEAQALLDQARQGAEAGAELYQANQALQARDYNLSLRLVAAARQKYQGLNNTRHNQELDDLEKWSRKVMALRDEVEAVTLSNPEILDPAVSAQLQNLYTELGRYGDLEGQDWIRQIFLGAELAQQNQAQWVLIAAGGLCILLLAWRIWLAFRRPAPESLL